jgi:Mg/Co/Ni transporter MgtE
VKYVFEDETTEDLARNMSTLQVRRMPALNRDKRLVGIVSLADIAPREDAKTMGQALADISAPGGAHSQSAH